MAPRRGESSSQELVVTGGLKGADQPTQIGTVPILNKLNYQVWASWMRLHLEGLELWDAIESENVVRKKDRQVMSILFSTISDEVMRELDVEKTAKQTWLTLKVKSGGVSRICKARIQSLKRDYENLSMDDDDLFLDYFGKLSCVVNELRSLGEVITDAEVAAKLLRSVSGKFDAITTSIEQFQDLETITLEEVIGTLKVHEDKLKARMVKREEKALLAKTFIKEKKKDHDPSNGRGPGQGRGKGRGRNSPRNSEEDEDEKPKDKSKVTCYNCQGKGHFANECRKPKKERPKKDAQEKAHLAEEEKETTLLMAIETSDEVLLQGISQCDLSKGMWYLDTSASRHMTGGRELICDLDDSYKGII